MINLYHDQAMMSTPRVCHESVAHQCEIDTGRQALYTIYIVGRGWRRGEHDLHDGSREGEIDNS